MRPRGATGPLTIYIAQLPQPQEHVLGRGLIWQAGPVAAAQLARAMIAPATVGLQQLSDGSRLTATDFGSPRRAG